MSEKEEFAISVLKDVAKQWHTQSLYTMVKGGTFRTFDQIVIDKIKELERCSDNPKEGDICKMK